MKNTTKIMLASILAMFLVVWATPSEARQGHSRSGDKHQLNYGRKSLSYSDTYGKHHFHPWAHDFKYYRSRRHLHKHPLKARYSNRNRLCRARLHHRQLSSIGIHHSRKGTSLRIGIRF